MKLETALSVIFCEETQRFISILVLDKETYIELDEGDTKDEVLSIEIFALELECFDIS